MRFSVFSSAVVAAVIGFSSTLALLIAAAHALSATQTQVASWVTAICLAKVCETIWLSWRYKTPIVTAWSTAGLALIGASIGFTIHDAVGAYILTAIMLITTGLFKPITTLVSKIPNSISAGMLGGILLPFVVNAAKAAQINPSFVLPLVSLFLIVRLKNAPLAVLVMLVAGALTAIYSGTINQPIMLQMSALEFISPSFSLSAIIGLAIPLYLVTMASQNLPGIAVLNASGYSPPSGPLISITGLFSLLSAFFGASTTNLAAITAAICTSKEAHPDKTKRWLTGPVYAICYLIFAIFGASLVGLFAILPSVLITLVAGLALLAPLANSVRIALQEETEIIPAMATFVITASGISFFGIGAAFWGLVIGIFISYSQVVAKKLDF